MQGGDISNEPAKRFLITWDVLAVLPPEHIKAELKARKRKNWAEAVDLWEIQPHTVGRMHLAENRYAIRWELAVFDAPREFCEAIEERLDEENIPVARAAPYLSPLALKDSLAYRPDVLAVVDIPDRGLFYGRHTLDPRSI